MSPAVTRERFIAGTVCPAHSEQDKIQMWGEDGMLYHECVACGYTDMLNAQGQLTPKELGIRVNQNAPKPANPKVQSAQSFPNPKLKKKLDV